MDSIEIKTHFMDDKGLIASIHLRYTVPPRRGEFIRFKGDVFEVKSVIHLTEIARTEIYCDKQRPR